MTVIVVTHEPDVAAYANRVVTFKDGKIINIHINDHPVGKSEMAQDPS
jgi:ABC-type lipoprotein export system ATPase subunit